MTDQSVREELADVLTYCIMLAERIGVDPDEIVRDELVKTREKCPVDRARGRSAKYDALRVTALRARSTPMTTCCASESIGGAA